MFPNSTSGFGRVRVYEGLEQVADAPLQGDMESAPEVKNVREVADEYRTRRQE